MTTKRKKIDLKPCPFCGGVPEVTDLDGFGGGFFAIECTKCGVSTRWMRRRQDAVIRWNRRVSK